MERLDLSVAGDSYGPYPATFSQPWGYVLEPKAFFSPFSERFPPLLSSPLLKELKTGGFRFSPWPWTLFDACFA